MRITNIECENYKSARLARLDDCGSLNILIGRNNSGKSNLLKAVKRFFDCLDPSLATIPTSAFDDSDAIYRDDEAVIDSARIAVTLRLSNDESAVLLDEIGREAPQVKNALEAIDAQIDLRVDVQIVRSPRMTFVQRVQIHSPISETVSTLLEVSNEVAIEIRERAVAIANTQAEIRALEEIRNSIDQLPERYFREEGFSSTFSRRIVTLSPQKAEQLSRELSSRIPSNSEPDVAKSALDDLSAEKQNRLEARRLEPLANAVQTFAGQQNQLPKYIVQLLARLAEIKIMFLDESRNPVGEKEARKLLSLKMRRGGSDNLRTIQSAVVSLLGVQIDAFESERGSRRPNSSKELAEMDVDNFLVQLNGSGIREALRLILDVSFDDPDVLLLEEPEVHLHPALEYALLQYLKEQSSRRQIFITTHSTNFLDTAEPNNIYLVSKDRSTAVQRLSLDDMGDELFRELGIRLSSVFMFDRLIFVEAPPMS